ncbi:MAG: hypothetical protein ACXWCZ_05520 [Flavisolibacter sp.]
MKKGLKAGTGFTIFILFFGVALLDAMIKKNVLLILFWVSMGLIFLFADNMKGQNQK